MVSIEPAQREEVFDIEVEGTGNFIANGAVSHNTRWVLDDLIGRVIEEDGLIEDGGVWEKVEYPAEAEEDEYRLPNGHVINFPAPKATKLRSKGEALHPERFPMSELEPHKKDPVTWQALYQQRPTGGEAAQFTEALIDSCACTMADIPAPLVHYSTYDLALGLRQVNDYSARTTGGLDMDDVLWLVDTNRDRWDTYDIIEEIIENHRRFAEDAVGIEKTHQAVAIRPVFDKTVAERSIHGLDITDLEHGNKDKVTRARPIQARMRQGKVRIPTDAPWFPQFKKELMEFPGGRHDDLVDAFSYLGHLLDMMLAAPRPEGEKPKASWRDKVAAAAAGSSDWRAA